MKIYLDREKQAAITGSYLLLDSNVISYIFSSPEKFDCFQGLFKSQYFLVDPFASFEFIRDAFLPDIYKKKLEFIKNEEFFLPVPSHSDILVKIRDNAIMLSRIYAHHFQKQNRNDFPPLVDLFLAGRLMLQTKTYLVTCDFKDFPLFVFDRMNLITIEDEIDNRVEIQILQFSETKYEKCIEELEKIEEKIKEKK